jgi:threonine 3-dehydrogenase
MLHQDLVPFYLLFDDATGKVIDLREKTLAEGLEDNGLDEVDLAIDTSGKGSARQSYLDVLSKRGVLVCAGHGEGLSLDVSRDLIAPERAVLGSEYFRYDELHSNLKILREYLPYLGQIITHRFAVQEIREAFEIFFRGETGKVLVEH